MRTAGRQRLKKLERENKDLRRAKALLRILRKALASQRPK